jgi:hypothetical protein
MLWISCHLLLALELGLLVVVHFDALSAIVFSVYFPSTARGLYCLNNGTLAVYMYYSTKALSTS